jgi:branched-chain amino acid transport system substrate-binding protein
MSRPRPLSRRRVLAGGLAAPFLLRPRRARAEDGVIRIGHVSPRTGPLAAFGEADEFILGRIEALLAPGLTIGGRRYEVRLIARDSQSSPSRAAEVASDLILGEQVDLITASSTPDTTNPVADQAEVNEVPCITSDCPWQSWFFGRKGDPATGFRWTWHFFWGLEDVVAAFTTLWNAAATNRVVGGLFPNDADGNAWGDARFGFPPALARARFTLVDPGRFQPLANDFTAQIAAFKAAGAEIVTGNLVPPDFATFWSQAAQQGFRPRIVTIGKALLFPSVIAALGPRGDGLSTEIWWSPRHPFRSGLTGESAAALCAAYSKATGRPWTQPIGFKHALFEVVLDVLRRSRVPKDPQAIRDAILATDYRSIVGRVHWGAGPVPNVSKTPLVAGQWRLAGGQPELVITENATAPEIPLGGVLQPLS